MGILAFEWNEKSIILLPFYFLLPQFSFCGFLVHIPVVQTISVFTTSPSFYLYFNILKLSTISFTVADTN